MVLVKTDQFGSVKDPDFILASFVINVNTFGKKN